MKSVKIGCGSGFWGDSPDGIVQLLECGDIDYLVLDYLAEITMSLLARVKQKRPEMGYAPDFVSSMAQHAATIKAKRIKVIANAGGVNPLACRDALVRAMQEKGVDLKIVAVVGDDVSGLADEFARAGVKEMSSGEGFPANILSANAYLGALPIAAALDAGADIVVTGRCVDSAVALGPLIHEFGWKSDQYDLLAAGSLAGHVIECGPQATGGIFTDWRLVADGWFNVGYPIAECYADGTFEVTKPAGTGGLVSWGTVAEQITYETGDPRAYVLPDVVCDLSAVSVEEVGENRVRVSGARGLPPTPTYKVSATFEDGYRCIATMLVRGFEAVDKGRAAADAILKRTREAFKRTNLGDYAETSVEILGGEDAYGANSRAAGSREVVVKIAVRHPQKAAVELFSREIAPATTGMAQGSAGIMSGRPSVQPVVRLFSFLMEKSRVQSSIDTGDRSVSVHVPSPPAEAASSATPASTMSDYRDAVDERDVVVPLYKLAYGRSGDKGDISNIAILARRPDYVQAIEQQLTPSAVARYFGALVKGKVERFDWPGLHGFNFLLHSALGGGGIASLRYDPQGKAHAQMLLDFPIRISPSLLPGDTLQ